MIELVKFLAKKQLKVALSAVIEMTIVISFAPNNLASGQEREVEVLELSFGSFVKQSALDADIETSVYVSTKETSVAVWDDHTQLHKRAGDVIQLEKTRDMIPPLKESREMPMSNASVFEWMQFCNQLSRGLGFEEKYKISFNPRERKIENWKESFYIAEATNTKNCVRLMSPTEWQEVVAREHDLKDLEEYNGANFLGPIDIREIGYQRTSTSDVFVRKAPVSSLKKTARGFYNLLGNVSEYCLDVDAETGEILKGYAMGGSYWDTVDEVRSNVKKDILIQYWIPPAIEGARLCLELSDSIATDISKNGTSVKTVGVTQ